MHSKRGADGELSAAEVSGVDVEVVQACNAGVEAEWRRTALPGSPQQTPSTPRRGHPASLQHQSIAQKRKKGGWPFTAAACVTPWHLCLRTGLALLMADWLSSVPGCMMAVHEDPLPGRDHM